ncbi:MAG TPA: hypothetical protein VLQ90_04170, partial [Pyrinomonadaceae bacterium]|nr:hypothetical protein [Pyrinomonadaceae bacterium]
LFLDAGFTDIRDERLFDPTPIPENYTGSSFRSREDYEQYKRTGSLMISGERPSTDYADFTDLAGRER